MGHVYIALCIIFTVYGQLILKWRINALTSFPDPLSEKVFFLVKLILTDFFIFSGFVSAFIASIFWMAAMSKFAISYAYPFMSLAFVAVMICSSFFLGESINNTKLVGTAFIVCGLIILSRGYS